MWLETPMEADLPLDVEVSPYPTALETTSAKASLTDEPAAEQVDTPEANSTSEPRDDQPASMPPAPLAVVPPHLRSQQPREPISIQIPSSQAPAPIPITSPNSPPQPIAVPLSAGPNVVQPIVPPQATSASVNEVAPPASQAARPLVGNAAVSAVEAPIDKNDESIEHARDELIAGLEAEIRNRRSQNTSDEELPRLEQQLRLMYLAADRIDDAVASVESLDEPQREAFKHLMFGLGVWLSPDEARRGPLRSAKVLRSLRDSTLELAAASKLELSSPIFCERVEQFGWYSEFPRNEFRPKQQVILYVEVQNFAAEKKGNSYETELQGSYQIFDAGGRIVAERQLPLDREICRNYRRDYFLAYQMYLPESIEPGRYRLELTIEDLKASGEYQGRKFGEGMIEFTIRQ